MADLTTGYMGITLKNPVIVASCTFSSKVDNIKKLEDAGAGALVIKSLFEEQIAFEMQKFAEEVSVGADSFAESLSYFPVQEHAGPSEHLMWIKKARAAVKMPLIGSINAITAGNWVEYARQMVETGIDGLELNVYTVQADFYKTGQEVENELLEIVQKVKSLVKVPLAVKLSPFYSSVGNVVKKLDDLGVQAVVLFNRFLQPDIDTAKESLKNEMVLSSAAEMKLPLRWIALLYGKIKADLSATTGVYTGDDVVKFLLAGASSVQVASTLYKNGLYHIGNLVNSLNDWMKEKGYRNIADFKGKLSQAHAKIDPVAFERAQYVDFILKQQ